MCHLFLHCSKPATSGRQSQVKPWHLCYFHTVHDYTRMVGTKLNDVHRHIVLFLQNSRLLASVRWLCKYHKLQSWNDACIKWKMITLCCNVRSRMQQMHCHNKVTGCTTPHHIYYGCGCGCAWACEMWVCCVLWFSYHLRFKIFIWRITLEWTMRSSG